MRRIFQIGSLVLLFFAIAFAGYAGVFRSVDVVRKEMGPFTFVYEDYVGPMQNVRPVFQRVESRLKELNVERLQGMGVYFDDPGVVAPEKLRSQCGALVDRSAVGRVEELQTAYPDLKLRQLPQSQALVVEFPLRTMFSYMIGPRKAYPALRAALKAQGLTQVGEAIELYDEKLSLILFILPVR